MLLDLLLIAGIVFAVNLLPAFGPPTAAILVAFSLSSDLPTAPLIACGALAAASGRFVLANGARHFRPCLSAERRTHLGAAEAALVENRGRSVAGLGLFALSPVPSGQLFTAAGLMELALLPLTAAFFAGRVVSYTIYVTGANAVKSSVGDTVVDSLTTPVGMAIQLIALVALGLFLRLDWADVLERRKAT